MLPLLARAEEREDVLPFQAEVMSHRHVGAPPVDHATSYRGISLIRRRAQATRVALRPLSRQAFRIIATAVVWTGGRIR